MGNDWGCLWIPTHPFSLLKIFFGSQKRPRKIPEPLEVSGCEGDDLDLLFDHFFIILGISILISSIIRVGVAVWGVIYIFIYVILVMFFFLELYGTCTCCRKVAILL